MVWTLHSQQQQRGAQLPARERTAPADATRDRAAQEHDRADLDVGGTPLEPGAYPASRLEQRGQNATPTEASVDWDAVVQPERAIGKE